MKKLFLTLLLCLWPALALAQSCNGLAGPGTLCGRLGSTGIPEIVDGKAWGAYNGFGSGGGTGPALTFDLMPGGRLVAWGGGLEYHAYTGKSVPILTTTSAGETWTNVSICQGIGGTGPASFTLGCSTVVAVTGGAPATLYDVFGYNNGGRLGLCRIAWSGTLARVTPLVPTVTFDPETDENQIRATYVNVACDTFGGGTHLCADGPYQVGDTASYEHCTYLGTYYSEDGNVVSSTVFSKVGSGKSPCLCVFSAHNRVWEAASVIDTGNEYTTDGTEQPMRGDANAVIKVVLGLPSKAIATSGFMNASTNGGAMGFIPRFISSATNSYPQLGVIEGGIHRPGVSAPYATSLYTRTTPTPASGTGGSSYGAEPGLLTVSYHIWGTDHSATYTWNYHKDPDIGQLGLPGAQSLGQGTFTVTAFH